MHAQHPAFLDFEASGLSMEGWPIEIGIATADGGHVRVASKLIRPHPDWAPEAWDPISAEVHNIGLDELIRAEEADIVARWTVERLSGRLVIADAPEFDGRWLAMLLATADIDPPTMLDFDHFVGSRLPDAGVRRVYGALDRLDAPHRAGPDAARLAQAWLAGQGAT